MPIYGESLVCNDLPSGVLVRVKPMLAPGRMDPEQHPLDRWLPPLPPPLYQSPPMPQWPAPALPDVPSGRHVLRWTLAALTLLAVAAAGVFVIVGRHPVASTTRLGAKHTASSALPSATPVPAAVAEAGQEYLAAVAPVNADRDRFSLRLRLMRASVS